MLLPSFFKSILATYLSTLERPVRLSSVVGSENAHLGGHYTVHILAVSTAQLNPTSACYCLPSTTSPPPIMIPLILNNTKPSTLTYSLTSLTSPPSTQNITVPASSLIHPSSSSSPKLDFDEIDEWALGASTPATIRHRLPTTKDPDDPFDLSPTQELYYLPISRTGIVRLLSIKDSSNVDVRIRRNRAPAGAPDEGVRVLPCPRAGFATREPEVHSCLNPSLPESRSVDLAVQGYEPLSVSWRTDRRGSKETIEGITDGEDGTTTTGVLSVPMNVSLTTVGRQTFFLDSVTDGCGNVVSYDSSSTPASGEVLPNTLVQREFVVHAIPEVMFGGECAKGGDLRLLKGKSKRLDFRLSALEGKTKSQQLDDSKWTVRVRFTPEGGGKGWERNVEGRSSTASLDVTEPGTYDIVSAKGKWCEGVVLVPSTCTVVEQPQPSLSTTFEPLLDVCSSEIGALATLHLTGTPPFTVTYLVGGRPTIHRSSHSRAEIRIEPPGPGEWEYRFTKIQDKFYPDGVTLDRKEAQYVTKQTVQLVGGAEWKDAAVGKTVRSCDGETVPVEVLLKGTAPWELEYSVVGSPSQVIKGIKSPLHSFDITIPPHFAKRGGKFSLSLESVRDGNGCKRPVIAPDLAIEVHRTKPTARFLGAEGSRSVVIKEDGVAKIPLSLTGEGPWNITFQAPVTKDFPKPEIIEFVTRTPNRLMSLQGAVRPGVYTLLTVRDQFCPGEVLDTDWTVVTLPRPTLKLAEDAGRVAKNGSVIRQAVCENTPDSVMVHFEGKPPFNAPYSLSKGQGEPLARALSAIQSRADLTLFTAARGHHTYTFTGVSDSLYTSPSPNGLLAPPNARANLVRLEQDVFPLPDASFKSGPKRGFCINEPLVSRASDELVVQLEGRPPFSIELDIRGQDGTRKPQRFPINNIETETWPLKLPFALDAAATHIVSLRRVTDANGCTRTIDRLKPFASVVVPVTEIASITAVLPQTSHCVGDFLDFVLQGAPPFTVVYSFNAKRQTVQLPSSKFSRVATTPGVFKIVSVGHGEDQCKAQNNESLPAKTVHPIPTAHVSEGKDIFVDIREGDQTEIIFTFTGTAPFTFTYSRRHPQDRTKDKTVLETHTVTGVQENRYSIFTSQEGTWSVSYIADAFCAYPPPAATGALRIEDKI
ncbi:hypothetical protein RQP46_008725 [Phenoliferia psychrophenolica]